MLFLKSKDDIHLVSLGKVSPDVVEGVTAYIQDTIQKKVFFQKEDQIPSEAYDDKRNQYNASALFPFLETLRRTPREKIIALVNQDIFSGELPFVFSEADRKNRAAVISSWRLEKNMRFFDCDPELFELRLKKEVLHHICIMEGLDYCTDPECVMFNSCTVSELDIKQENLCERCKILI